MRNSGKAHSGKIPLKLYMTSPSVPVTFPKLRVSSKRAFRISTRSLAPLTDRLGNKNLPKMAKGSLFRGQKNGGYCNIHKGTNFNNSAKGCSCLFLCTRKRHAQKIKARGPQGPAAAGPHRLRARAHRSTQAGPPGAGGRAPARSPRPCPAAAPRGPAERPPPLRARAPARPDSCSRRAAPAGESGAAPQRRAERGRGAESRPERPATQKSRRGACGPPPAATGRRRPAPRRARCHE